MSASELDKALVKIGDQLEQGLITVREAEQRTIEERLLAGIGFEEASDPARHTHRCCVCDQEFACEDLNVLRGYRCDECVAKHEYDFDVRGSRYGTTFIGKCSCGDRSPRLSASGMAMAWWDRHRTEVGL